MALIPWKDGTNTVKIKVDSNSQICLNALDFLAWQLKESGKLTTGGRLNHSGGYLMFFFNEQNLLLSLDSIKATVLEHDSQAKILVNHCPEIFDG